MTETRPTIAEPSATGSHHARSLNTPHAAAENPMIATNARACSTFHSVPLGGGVLPAMAAVIHRKVVPNRNNPPAITFLKVNIESPPLAHRGSLSHDSLDLPTAVSGPIGDVVLRPLGPSAHLDRWPVGAASDRLACRAGLPCL